MQLIWPESEKRYHSRNAAAGLGVVEDPATGAAAAAFGGYLRELGLIGENGRVHHQPRRRDGPPERAHGQRHGRGTRCTCQWHSASHRRLADAADSR